MDIRNYTLNGTTFSLDQATGALMELSCEGVAPMQKISGKNRAVGLLDLAWPVHYEYETLRANPTGESHAQPPMIESGADYINIIYNALPQTYDTPEIEDQLAGRVYARVELRAMEDGKSVSMRCVVTNNSQTPVEQVVFPNFDSLTPTDTRENARLTMMGGVINPYTYDAPRGMRGPYYAMSIRSTGLMLTPSGLQTGYMMGRWYDWGSYKGGFSLYRKHWGWDQEDPQKMGEADPTWIRYDTNLDQVRICGVHNVNVKPGQTYDTGLYVMTAHTGPWIFGVAPYKAWLHQNMHRVLPMPKRAKEMMGFYTICMTNYPKDPRETFCEYKDMPAIAADAAEHGLYDLNVWKGFNYTLPLTEDCFYDNWGGIEGWNKNVRKCQEMGVVVTPFVSWLSLWSETCDNYGITKRSGDWAGSANTIPRMGAHYAKKWACWQLWDHTEPHWAKDVLDGLRFLRDKTGCPDISWDQYVLGDHSDNTLHDIINEYRLETEKMYPGTVWSAESTLFFESELDNSDFTWNGMSRRGGRWDWDLRPFMHVVQAMRPNMDVGRDNPQDARYILMDNLMMNLGFSNKETGKWDLIGNAPELSEALKACIHVRNRYLDYFTDGLPMGDCVLAKDCDGAYVTAYQHDGKMLLFVMKEDDQDRQLSLNLAPFMGNGVRKAVVRGEADEVILETEIAPDGVVNVSGPKEILRMVEII